MNTFRQLKIFYYTINNACTRLTMLTHVKNLLFILAGLLLFLTDLPHTQQPSDLNLIHWIGYVLIMKGLLDEVIIVLPGLISFIATRTKALNSDRDRTQGDDT